MAFLTSSVLTLTSKSKTTSSVCHQISKSPQRRRRSSIICTQTSPLPSDSSSSTDPSSDVASIPGSLQDAVSQAVSACQLAISNGKSRLFVEIDTTNGDATYTMLKTSLPITRQLLPLFSSTSSRLCVLLPDAGAAALARRDWANQPNDDLPPYEILGIEQSNLNPDEDSGIFIVVPRASEVNLLASTINAAQFLPVIVVNPDLVDMGVTGLSLNARNLRREVIDTFEQAYYLKVFSWGVLLRAYPGKWGLWVDAPGTPVGFRLVKELDKRPSSDDIDEILSKDESASGSPVSGFFTKLKRFLRTYSQG